MNIFYFPTFDDQAQTNDHTNRAVWYFDCLIGVTIQLYCDFVYEYSEIEYFSNKLPGKYKSMVSSKRMAHHSNTYFKGDLPSKNDYIVLWKDESKLSEKEKQLLLSWRSKRIKVFDVNNERRMEGSFYIEVSRYFFEADNSFLNNSQEKFRRLAETHSGKDNSFLFCTGPSIKEYANYCYDGSTTIACNTAINDEQFMKSVQPDIIVFADPIFHFGCSSYSEAFRNRLRDTAERYQFDIVIPIKYYPLFIHSIPDLAERTIAIPYINHESFTTNLNEVFSVKSMDNILTFLMLPLATSFSDTIYIMGCDGRPLDEDDYFWSHNQKTQLTDEMQNIQLSHPSFFQLEYNEYYLRHCENLERFFYQGEKIGKRFISLGFSHIPALKNRAYRYRHLADEHSKELFLSINPDAKDHFGHYFHYDERLYESLQEGEELLILANRNANLDDKDFSVINALSNTSWGARWNPDIDVFNGWCEQILVELREVAILRRPITVFMYMGAIRYYAGLVNIAINIERKRLITYKINLFYAHMDYALENFRSSENFKEYESLLNYYLKVPHQTVEILSDSEKLTTQILRDFGVKLNSWPMIGVTNRRLIEKTKSQFKNVKNSSNTITVLFPGNGQITKGYDLACNLISSFTSQPTIKGKRITFVIRDQLRDTVDNNQILADKLLNASSCDWVKIVSGHLEENEYLNLFIEADIVALPYRKSAFSSRTSGCLVDALSFGKPILTIKGTWLGDWVDKLKVGATVEEGPNETAKMKDGIEFISSNDFSYPDDIVAQFSPNHLRESLLSKINISEKPYHPELMASKIQKLLKVDLKLAKRPKPPSPAKEVQQKLKLDAPKEEPWFLNRMQASKQTKLYKLVKKIWRKISRHSRV